MPIPMLEGFSFVTCDIIATESIVTDQTNISGWMFTNNELRDDCLLKMSSEIINHKTVNINELKDECSPKIRDKLLPWFYPCHSCPTTGCKASENRQIAHICRTFSISRKDLEHQLSLHLYCTFFLEIEDGLRYPVPPSRAFWGCNSVTLQQIF